MDDESYSNSYQVKLLQSHVFKEVRTVSRSWWEVIQDKMASQDKDDSATHLQLPCFSPFSFLLMKLWKYSWGLSVAFESMSWASFPVLGLNYNLCARVMPSASEIKTLPAQQIA